VGEVVDLPDRLGDRLALLGGQRRRQRLRVLLDQVGGLRQDVRPLLDVGRGPRPERPLGSLHGQLDVGRAGGGDRADR
jgi:hypothetical protein